MEKAKSFNALGKNADAIRYMKRMNIYICVCVCARARVCWVSQNTWTHLTANNSSNNNDEFFFVSALKITYYNNY